MATHIPDIVWVVVGPTRDGWPLCNSPTALTAQLRRSTLVQHMLVVEWDGKANIYQGKHGQVRLNRVAFTNIYLKPYWNIPNR